MPVAEAEQQTYNPQIRKGGALYSVPTPLMARAESYDRRIMTEEIPLTDGVSVFDVRRGALILSCDGIMHVDTNAGEGPSDLQETIDTFEALMTGSNTVNGFTFYTHYDNVRGNYRYYPKAICRAFSINHTSRTLVHVPYSFSLLIPGGRAYTLTGYGAGTPPDAGSGLTEYLEGPLHIELETNDTTGAFYLQNSDGDYVAKIDDKGNIYYTGVAVQVDSITGPDE